MFIKRSTYNEMLDLINQQRKEIEGLQSQVRSLKNDKRLLFNMLKGDPFDIDYPDTKGGNTANTGIDNINDILNL